MVRRAMKSLVNALERFNRKERNLLVRAAIGNPESALQLSVGFRAEIVTALGLKEEIPADAWWATDYHIAWLAGALSVYALGEGALEQTWPNPEIDHKRLMEPNQEDIDLIVSWDNHIVLIEAKAYSCFSNPQLKSKIARLDFVQGYYKELVGSHNINVDFHLLLISPRAPAKLDVAPPSWLCPTGIIPWVKLNGVGDRLMVSRCNTEGEVGAYGDRWRLVPQHS